LREGARVLSFLFGFNARLGRLHYFLASIGLAIVATIVFLGLIFAAYGAGAQPGIVRWLIILFVAIVLWANAMLLSMRFRDIGWDPVCVVPIWIASMIVDAVVAMKVPEWSLTAAHTSTVVGASINFGLSLALMFWPSGDAPDDDHGGRTDYAPRSTGRGAPTSSEARIARVSGGEFGRRTF
jgi:uncharacterized membrane protein YhaH (DUF805 family)